MADYPRSISRLGIAFGVVLLIIYILIVGWFQDFGVPIIMMIAVPLSLIGILMGHRPERSLQLPP